VLNTPEGDSREKMTGRRGLILEFALGLDKDGFAGIHLQIIIIIQHFFILFILIIIIILLLFFNNIFFSHTTKKEGHTRVDTISFSRGWLYKCTCVYKTYTQRASHEIFTGFYSDLFYFCFSLIGY